MAWIEPVQSITCAAAADIPLVYTFFFIHAMVRYPTSHGPLLLGPWDYDFVAFQRALHWVGFSSRIHGLSVDMTRFFGLSKTQHE